MGRSFCLAGLLIAASAALAQSGERTLVVAPSQPIAGETRTALVIGNGAYKNGPLRNPVNDARAMAKTLSSTGFEVILVENATHASMQRAIRAFGDKLTKGGVGLFYYAGHGIQARGRNYLIPVSADIAREDEIEFASLDVNLVLAKMDSAKNGLNIVILDACRNNPFGRAFRSVQVGLAQIDAPTGTFIAFATAPGSIAADGSGDNGVYTKHLLAEMDTPGLAIEQMFKQVRNGVMAETNGRQIPWESSSLRGEFAFRPGVQPSVAEAVAAALKRERDAQQAEVQKLQAALDRQQREGGVTEALRRERDAQQTELQRLQEALVRQRKEVAVTETLKREREAQQAELQKLQAALDRQQKQLESLGLRPPAPAPAVAPPATVKPVVTASAAPTAVAAATGRLPQPGDTWTYRLTEPSRVDGPKQRQYTVKVAAISSGAILDQYAVDMEKPGEWAHSSGGYIAALGRSLFSPYLFAFDNAREYGPIRVQIADPACSGPYICEASAQISGRERVKVPAGEFDTIKVTVEHSWRVTSSVIFSPPNYGTRRLTVWYAPEVKRAVKFISRPTVSQFGPVDTEFDLELTSYQLKP